MPRVTKPERVTQIRVLKLFTEMLGYRALGDLSEERRNSNIDEEILGAWLGGRGVSREQISRVVYRLRQAADNPTRSLYDNNKAFYSLLRYGVDVQTEVGRPNDRIPVVDWEHPDLNDWAIGEEVTLRGQYERRPDLVLYLNGIAIAVIELKASHVSVGDGIRQLLSNQSKEFNAWFFATVQIVFAGNDSEGLRYGTIGTPEKYFLSWKEDEHENDLSKLDKYLVKMCRKERLLELIDDFVLFDGGIKKLPRAHQYFAVKKAQKQLADYRGGVIWHTQGSGKSIVMVYLAKWLLEHLPRARVLVLTDRDELDKQIETVFESAGEDIYRTSSGDDLRGQLAQPSPRLLCSLIHKFGRRGVDDYESFLEELRGQPCAAVGEIFVFVDECHRTQSGKLHKTLKAMLPGAVFVGFTGTPLLASDREATYEVFGKPIDTYKFSEAVQDEVVLDLVYEARDIPQELGSRDKIDAWFDAKTRGLNDWRKAALREQWGTLQQVLSSRSRMERIVEDIVFDFSVKPRLVSQRGNAILVASSIYEAVRYYEIFQKTPLKGRCALVTSYSPRAQDVTLEEVGANTESDKQVIRNVYLELLRDVQPAPGKSDAETYEDDAKSRFIRQPDTMRLLIVVDKLLTGFDAPSCTYLYIDKSMQDHGLFQAICRTNRLDGEDKMFGYIVDYKNLFPKVQGAIAVYSSTLDHSAGGPSPEIMLEERLKRGKEKLDQALEVYTALCHQVPPPSGELEYIRHYCGNTEIPDDLKRYEPQRVMFYKSVAGLLRAYAGIADELERAGYDRAEIKRIKTQVDDAVKLRQIIRQASGETIDLKAYEADMRHLIDTYIEAGTARTISDFGETGLLELIVKSGMAEALKRLPSGVTGHEASAAEVIANNVRSKIIRERLTDPIFYDKMSELLSEVLADLKARRIDYQQFLEKIARLAEQVVTGMEAGTPRSLNTPGRKALYHTLSDNEELALRVDELVHRVKPDDFRGNGARENIIKESLLPLLDNDVEQVEKVFAIIKAQPEY